VKGFSKVFERVILKNSSKIMRSLGLAGLLLAPIQAVRATPMALWLLENKRTKEQRSHLTVVEIVQTAGRCYIPTVLLCGISLGFLGWSGSIDGRRNAALITAYSLSETALQEYQSKVISMFGNKKEQSIRDDIAKDRLEKNPLGNREIILTHKGTTLCYDSFSGRYFKADIDKLRKAENEINRRLISEMYVSLNEFYDEIGLTRVGAGDDFGWNVGKEFLALHFSSQLADDDTPCLVVDYKVVPEYQYH
jgi:hypothetical protein